MAIDPICGMTVDPATAAGQYEYKGVTYYFCAKSCLETFKADPEKALQTASPGLISLGKKKSLPMMPEASAGAGVHLDPVCGMAVQPETAAGSHVHENKTYYFCSPGCLAKFRDDPSYYLTPPAQRMPKVVAVPTGSKVEYICPMDPEVVSTEPGACPICGMALEPKIVTLEERPNPELLDMSRRFWISLGPTFLVTILAMADMAAGGCVLNGPMKNWIQLVLATPVVLWGGWPFFERAWNSLVHRAPNMFTLIGLGTGAAYGYSVLATIAPDILPASFHASDGSIPV